MKTDTIYKSTVFTQEFSLKCLPVYINTTVLNFYPNNGSAYYTLFVSVKQIYGQSPIVKTLFMVIFYCQNLIQHGVIFFMKTFLLKKYG